MHEVHIKILRVQRCRYHTRKFRKINDAVMQKIFSCYVRALFSSGISAQAQSSPPLTPRRDGEEREGEGEGGEEETAGRD